MDYLWTPWRFAYVSTADVSSGCVFCEQEKVSDKERFIVHRGQYCYILLNIFPYTSGHVMVVPYEHTDELQKLHADAASEMIMLAQRMESVLRQVYKPDGINLGMNIGKAAGAGVAGHLHMHVLPRWLADSNFMTVVAETRVLPEALERTWERLRSAWEGLG
ncbi:MAG: HIT domain-containing protein [Terriglobales bacterium]|jgi:ATP adenylyltransferase